MKKDNPLDLPPTAFSNAVADIDAAFSHRQWRKSKEWRLFVAGYNAAVTACSDKIKAQYNLGQTVARVFKETE